MFRRIIIAAALLAAVAGGTSIGNADVCTPKIDGAPVLQRDYCMDRDWARDRVHIAALEPLCDIIESMPSFMTGVVLTVEAAGPFNTICFDDVRL